MATPQSSTIKVVKLLILAVILIALLQVGFAVTGAGNENVHYTLSCAMDALGNASYLFPALGKVK